MIDRIQVESRAAPPDPATLKNENARANFFDLPIPRMPVYIGDALKKGVCVHLYLTMSLSSPCLLFRSVG